MGEIVNTAQFRFPPGSPRPSWMEIATFIKQLDTDPTLMETVYKTARDRSLFVKFKSLDAMMESIKRNSEPRMFVYANGQSVAVRMCVAGTNVQYVRVFDLPPELSDHSLSLVLGSFGNVERVVREKFPVDTGLDYLFTGVRGVYIDVKREIPPAVDVLDWKARIFYYGLKDTCFMCHAVGHRKDSCPQRAAGNKKEKHQQEPSSPSSYADIVSGKETAEKPSETVEDDVIEIVEEELDELDAFEEEQVESVASETTIVSDKEERRRSSIKQLEEVAKAIQEAMSTPSASQRRAQFAASRSGSGSGSAPRKKCIRRTFY